MSNPTVTHNFRNSLANEFLASFAREDESYYLFIGHVLPWSNEANTPASNNAIISHRDAWSNMIAAKRVRGDSVRIVLPIINWSTNTVYTAYDDANTTYFTNVNNKLYVVTSNNECYKCLDNSNGANSTVAPSGTNNNNGFIRTPDGYLWKYMFQIDTQAHDNLFYTSDLFPVPQVYVPTTELIPGTIDRAVLLTGGLGYNSANSGNNLSIVSIVGDGSGAAATVNVNSTGVITAITIVSPGSGYTYANISFVGGTGATARAVISPKDGHASAPAEELNAKQVLMAMRIGKDDSTEGGTFTIQNDFRQFGLVKNPTKYSTTDIANSNSYSQTVNVTVVADSNPAFVIDDYVYQQDSSGNTVFSGYIVDIGNLSNTAIVKITQTQGSVVTGALMFNKNAATSKRVQSFDNLPMQPYSGQMLYFENISKTQRNDGQSEIFKILFNF